MNKCVYYCQSARWQFLQTHESMHVRTSTVVSVIRLWRATPSSLTHPSIRWHPSVTTTQSTTGSTRSLRAFTGMYASRRHHSASPGRHLRHENRIPQTPMESVLACSSLLQIVTVVKWINHRNCLPINLLISGRTRASSNMISIPILMWGRADITYNCPVC